VKQFIVLLVITAAVVGCNQEPEPSVLSGPQIKIDEIRGDRLGMSIREYIKKHPNECGEHDSECIASETYAGVGAMKDASFTKDGKLWKITYVAPALQSSQLLTALEEKYGQPPGCTDAYGKQCRWENGKSSVRFLSLKSGVNIDFTDSALSDQAIAEYQADQASKRKADQ
jgi:hypothetical protein